jgi:hypothetical protein
MDRSDVELEGLAALARGSPGAGLDVPDCDVRRKVTAASKRQNA